MSVRKTVKTVQACCAQAAACVKNVSVTAAGVRTVITAENVQILVSAEEAVRNVPQSVRIVMRNAPIVRMRKSAADAMFVRIAPGAKGISAITVKPVSIVQSLSVIAEEAVPSVPLFVKAVRNNVKTAEIYAKNAVIVPIASAARAGVINVTSAVSVSSPVNAEAAASPVLYFVRNAEKNVTDVHRMKCADPVWFAGIVPVIIAETAECVRIVPMCVPADMAVMNALLCVIGVTKPVKTVVMNYVSIVRPA